MKYLVKHTHTILIYNSYIYNIMMVDYNKDIHQKEQLDINIDKSNFAHT